MPTIEIPLSKTKIILLILGSIAFVALGVWLWTIADQQTRRDPIFVKGVSVVCIIFFGAASIVGMITFFSKRPGLIIDDNGIFIFNSFTERTFVPWQTVTGMGEVSIHRTKLILIFINNVDELIAGKNKWIQKMMRYSVKAYGTPISVSSNTMQISHKELVGLLERSIADNAKVERAAN